MLLMLETIGDFPVFFTQAVNNRKSIGLVFSFFILENHIIQANFMVSTVIVSLINTKGWPLFIGTTAP
ncbi:hypothetical protein [Vibrio algicola]|uniref:hypothetical protein n=1 Tax=Vibrio algicola TaxID=2662262 RepID=UPI0015B5859F|nr:hypothetical protein [Vibrio algicola]